MPSLSFFLRNVQQSGKWVIISKHCNFFYLWEANGFVGDSPVADGGLSGKYSINTHIIYKPSNKNNSSLNSNWSKFRYRALYARTVDSAYSWGNRWNISLFLICEVKCDYRDILVLIILHFPSKMMAITLVLEIAMLSLFLAFGIPANLYSLYHQLRMLLVSPNSSTANCLYHLSHKICRPTLKLNRTIG